MNGHATAVEVLYQGVIAPDLARNLNEEFGAVHLSGDDERSDVIARYRDSVRALVTAGPPGVDAELMSALPNLGAIVSLADGYDPIDVDAARERGIGVSNTAPEELCDSVADTAVALTLNAVRRFSAAERWARDKREYDYDNEFTHTRDLTGTHVGILGLGKIGTKIATRLAAFDCYVSYHNRHPLPDSSYRYVETLAALAKSVDVLIVATTGGPHAHQLVDRDVLEALGPSGYLVNIARGDVVDQDALVALCSSGGLAGAGLDVFVGEPRLPDDLVALDNVVITPHVGGGTDRTMHAMRRCLLDNLRSYLQSGQLLTPVVEPTGRGGRPG